MSNTKLIHQVLFTYLYVCIHVPVIIKKKMEIIHGSVLR